MYISLQTLEILKKTVSSSFCPTVSQHSTECGCTIHIQNTTSYSPQKLKSWDHELPASTFFFFFSEDKTQIQKDEVTCPRAHS